MWCSETHVLLLLVEALLITGQTWTRDLLVHSAGSPNHGPGHCLQLLSLSLSFALPALPLQSGFTQFEISEEQNNWSSICTSSRFNKWDSCFTQLIWWLSGVFGVISYTEARELRNGCSWCCNSAATYSSPLCVRQKKERKEMKKKEKKKKFDTDKVSGAEYDENNVSTEMTDGGCA